MFHIVLYEPEIPPNTGNIIRLAANTGAQLHLIKPLGFTLDDRHLQRASLDYHEYATVKQYDDFSTFITTAQFSRIFACSTKGIRFYSDIKFQANDALLFGPETRGLPAKILAKFSQENIIRIPMLSHSRSLNLANSVAIILYEALRKIGFSELK